MTWLFVAKRRFGPAQGQKWASYVEWSGLRQLRLPASGDLDGAGPPGFRFVGFDVVDVHGDVSALTSCGGFDDVFAKPELSECGLLREIGRAYQVQRDLRKAYPDDSHTRCDVWAIWRKT